MVLTTIIPVLVVIMVLPDHGQLTRDWIALIALFVMAWSFPLSMLAWQRFVLLGEMPRFGLLVPAKAYWSFLWRWWAFGLIKASVAATGRAFLLKRVSLTTNENGVTHAILTFLTECLAIYLFSRSFLVLPYTVATSDDAGNVVPRSNLLKSPAALCGKGL